MIINTVVSTPKIEFKETFIEHMKTLSELVRQEEGCITYELFVDPYHPNRLFLFEEWKNQEALDKHLTQPHMLAHFEEAKPWFEGNVVMNTYESQSLYRQTLKEN